MDSLEFLVHKKRKLSILYTEYTDGGGFRFGKEFTFFLKKYKTKFKKCLEVFSGPGFIGFDLLDKGIIQYLDLTDISKLVKDLCNTTIKKNSLEHKCNFYLSNNLKNFPKKKYDLIVGNPPHFKKKLRRKIKKEELMYLDLDLKKHKSFYKEVGKLMNKKSLLVIQENFEGTNVNDFKDMINNNGLYIDKFQPCKTDKRFYFLVVKKS